MSALVTSVLSPGFSGIWTAVDMTWTLSPDVSPEDLADWESYWNILIRQAPTVLLCQYSRVRLGPEVLHHQLKTHPLAVLGQTLYPNPFYESPEVSRSRTAYAKRVDRMFQQLELARVAKEEHERRLRNEVMVKEVHHRVKNNLQVTASLLTVHANSVQSQEAREALLQAASRIQTIAGVHHQLYRQDRSSLDLTAYFRDLLPEAAAVAAAGKDVRLTVNGALIPIDLDAAIPCALIVNELVSNACNHAFPSGAGAISVRLARRDGWIEVEVKDDG